MIKKTFQILFNHKWAVFLAVLIGLIMAFPQAYFRYENKDVYKGVEMQIGGADELFYLGYIQEARDGHFSAANPYWAEGKELPYLQPPLGEIIASFPGLIFNLNLADTILLGRFVFPIIIFLLIYALIYHLTERKSISLAVSTTILLSTNLINPKMLWDLLIRQKVSYSFLPFSRVVVHQIQLIFFFGFLLVFWLFMVKKKWLYSFVGGIILGLSFYVYPYTWTFIYAFLGCLALILIWEKKWFEVKNIFLISGTALLIGIPYFWNLWQAMQHPLYSELSLRFGLVKTHAPQAGALVLILLAVFLLLFPRREKTRYYFCLALVLAPFIVLNQQIITGHVMIPAHYHWYFHKPLMVMIMIIIIFYWLEKITKKKTLCYGLLGFILAINFYYALMAQAASYKYFEPLTIEEQRYGLIFNWLNKHAQKDETVFTNDILSNLIPVYTSLNSASALGAHYCLISDENQLWQRMFLQYRLNGLAAEESLEKFLDDKVKISGSIYGEYYRKGHGKHENIPDEKINSISRAYQESLSVPLENILRKYQVEYIIWDTAKEPNWQLDRYMFLEEVYQAEDIKVYQLNAKS